MVPILLKELSETITDVPCQPQEREQIFRITPLQVDLKEVPLPVTIQPVGPTLIKQEVTVPRDQPENDEVSSLITTASKTDPKPTIKRKLLMVPRSLKIDLATLKK